MAVSRERNFGVETQEYEYDFAVDGGAIGAKTLSAKPNKAGLPLGCILKAVWIHVTAAATSGGAATIAVGTAAAPGLYKAAAAYTGYTLDALFVYSTPLVTDAENDLDVTLTIAGAALTAGKMKVIAEYIHHMP